MLCPPCPWLPLSHPTQLDARKALTIVDFVPSSAPAHVLSTPLGRESTNEEIMESVQRLGKLVCDKLPQTHLPSLTKSTLALVKVCLFGHILSLSLPSLRAASFCSLR